jgi:antitoxin component of RelBE/YafQ-DinJ toxin-antitoxin module
MTKDHARLTVLLDAAKKKEFDALCAELGTNASQVVRELILHYLASGEQEPNLLARAMSAKGKPGTRGSD